MVTVVIVDDQELVRGGIRLILTGEPDLEVVGEADNGVDACTLIRETRPDVALVDVQMPTMDGIEAVRTLAMEGSSTRFVMLTTFDLDDYVFAALEAGAAGFLLKDMAAEDIVSVVRQAARGVDSLLAPSLTRRLIERRVGHRASQVPPDKSFERLTSRELDVVRQIARGLTNAEIAKALYIEESTAKTHVARIFSKLGARDRVQVVIAAYRNGLMD